MNAPVIRSTLPKLLTRFFAFFAGFVAVSMAFAHMPPSLAGLILHEAIPIPVGTTALSRIVMFSADGTYTQVFGFMFGSVPYVPVALQTGTYVYTPASDNQTATITYTAADGGPAIAGIGIPGPVTIYYRSTGPTSNGSAGIYNDQYTGPFDLKTIGHTESFVNGSVLVNLTKGGTATAGFVLGGMRSHYVFVRAIGPGLAPFGVAPLLADPQITIFKPEISSTPNGPIHTVAQIFPGIETRDQANTVRSSFDAVAQLVGAFAVPDSSADTMYVGLLDPGNYTVQCASASGNDSGSVLLEWYILP